MLAEGLPRPQKGIGSMKKYMKISLNKRLNAISMAAFIPMFLVMLYLLVSLSGATKAYADITQSVTYANQYAMDFKERMDNSMYLAVIGKKSMEELGDGETTVNGIVTVNPYEYIAELSAACDKLSDMATVDINRNQITRLKNSLKSLERCVSELEEGIKGKATYQENVDYLDENISLKKHIYDTYKEGFKEDFKDFPNRRIRRSTITWT